MSISLPLFSSPGVRAAAARGAPLLHSDLKGVSPTTLISPITELRRGKRVGSSTVTALEILEPCIPVTRMFLRAGFPAAEVERGVATALKVSCVHVSLPLSRSYSPGEEPGSTQIRSANATGKRKIFSYYLRLGGVRHYQVCSLDDVQRVQFES